MPFILFRTEPQALLYADIEVGRYTNSETQLNKIVFQRNIMKVSK